MSQLIVILLLIYVAVRAVKGKDGKGARTPRKPVYAGQAEGGSGKADAEKPQKPDRAAAPEGYTEYPRHKAPSPEPIACGNAREHSHAHTAKAAVTAEDLRRAVITSEILANPVSLRDE